LIDTNKIDSEFRKDVQEIPESQKLMMCQQCGKCTPFCPITRLNGNFSPRKLVRMAQLGLKDDIVPNKKYLWLCANCYACSEICPQRIDPTNIIITLKNMAARIKKIPIGKKTMYDQLAKTGLVFEVGDEQNAIRKEMGLPLFPEVDVAQTEHILRSTGVYEIMARRK